ILQLQTVRGQLELAVQDDALAWMKDVGEERLVEPDRTHRAGAVAEEDFEDLEARAPRRTDTAAHHFSSDGGGVSRPQRGNRLEAAAIFVANWKAVEEVLDRGKTDAQQICGAPRSDSLQVLQRRLKRIR